MCEELNYARKRKYNTRCVNEKIPAVADDPMPPAFVVLSTAQGLPGPGRISKLCLLPLSR